MLKFNGYEPLERKEIPFTLIYTNPLKTCDLELNNGECFELLNKDIKVLLEDGFLLAPLNQLTPLIKNVVENMNKCIKCSKTTSLHK